MSSRRVIWPEPVRNKLLSFRSDHFTPQETYDYVIQLILESEQLLLNPYLTKTYTEISGEYKGVSRVVVRKCRIYYEKLNDKIIVIAVKFPGEK